MSEQERVSWVALLVTAVISLWYFARVLGLPGDSPLFGAGMAVFAFILIIAASGSTNVTVSSTCAPDATRTWCCLAASPWSWG